MITICFSYTRPTYYHWFRAILGWFSTHFHSNLGFFGEKKFFAEPLNKSYLSESVWLFTASFREMHVHLFRPTVGTSEIMWLWRYQQLCDIGQIKINHFHLYKCLIHCSHLHKGAITLQRLGRQLPTYGPALGSANESPQTLMKVGLRHRTPVNVAFVDNFQHIEKMPKFENECWWTPWTVRNSSWALG